MSESILGVSDLLTTSIPQQYSHDRLAATGPRQASANTRCLKLRVASDIRRKSSDVSGNRREYNRTRGLSNGIYQAFLIRISAIPHRYPHDNQHDRCEKEIIF